MFDVIDRLKALDLRDLHELVLDRSGQGRCPFPDHTQTGESGAFTVFPDNGFYCFGCGRGGTAIDFWMHLHGHRDAREAILDLAANQGLEFKPSPDQERVWAAQKKRADALEYATTYYAKTLAATEPVMEYLERRGFSQATITKHRLGFANKRLITSITQANLDPDDFEEAGLIRRRQDGARYDFFGYRITFPIVSRGKVVNMSGRVLPPELKGDQQAKKYLNLPGNKLDTLFCQDYAAMPEAFVCEGLPDTLTLVQAGFPAAGQQGTNGMRHHAAKFAKHRRVYCCFDTDDAGREAAIKAASAIHMALIAGTVRLVRLPPCHKDINEFFMHGGTAETFRELAATAPTLIDYLALALPPATEPEERTAALKEIMSLVATVSSDQQGSYLERIAAASDVKVTALKPMLKAASTKAATAAATAKDEEADDDAAGLRLDYEEVRTLVPVQDFRFNSPAVGNYTAYVRVKGKEVTDDGKTVDVERNEPMLVSATHVTGAPPKIEIKRLASLGLTAVEKRRIPYETIIAGRWRTAGSNPHAVQSFVEGRVTAPSGVRIFREIVALIEQYVWLPNPIDSQVVALYIMATYVFRLFFAFPYLHLHGIRESGKTNTLRFITDLAFNAVAASNISTASVFRLVEGTACCLLIDEAEQLNNPKPDTASADFVLLSNAGYKNGATAIRNEQNERTKKWEPTAYDAYCPKVFASIAELGSVLASRCIKVQCLRALPGDVTGKLQDMAQRQRHLNATFAELRDQLHCWGLLTFPAVDQMYSQTLDGSLPDLRGRERELWLPLITLAAILDNEASGGDEAKAGELAALGQLITPYIVTEQTAKERLKRVSETDESEELAILKATYTVLSTGRLMRALPDLASPKPIWITSELLDAVNEAMKEGGFLTLDRAVSAKKLLAILTKTFAISASDRSQHSIGGGKKRCIAIEPEHLCDIVKRLGGVVDDEE